MKTHFTYNLFLIISKSPNIESIRLAFQCQWVFRTRSFLRTIDWNSKIAKSLSTMDIGHTDKGKVKNKNMGSSAEEARYSTSSSWLYKRPWSVLNALKPFHCPPPPTIKLCAQVSLILLFWKWMPRLWMVVVAVDLAVNFTQGARQWCSWLEGGGNLGTVTFQYFSSIFFFQSLTFFFSSQNLFTL